MSNPTVLVLARDAALAQELASPLERGGFLVTCASTPTYLETLDLGAVPDLLILDWNLVPLREVPALVKQSRALGLPCLVALAPQDLTVFDVTLGVSDFLFTPVQPQELVARVRNLLGRTQSADSDSIVRAGDLAIDQERYEVALDGRRVLLTFKEYQLLVFLATNPGRVFTREVLLRQVWEYDYYGGTRTVDVHIRRLRSKIEDADHSFIETVRNVGYRFRPTTD